MPTLAPYNPAVEERDWAYERVRRFLSEASGRKLDSIGLDDTLAAFDADSLEDVEFVMELEDELGVEIPEPNEPFRTVGDLVAFVRSLRP